MVWSPIVCMLPIVSVDDRDSSREDAKTRSHPARARMLSVPVLVGRLVRVASERRAPREDRGNLLAPHAVRDPGGRG